MIHLMQLMHFPHASLHSYETLLSAGYNVMLYDPWIHFVRVTIRDTDSFRLSYNDRLDVAVRAMRVRHSTVFPQNMVLTRKRALPIST